LTALLCVREESRPLAGDGTWIGTVEEQSRFAVVDLLGHGMKNVSDD
jgi:hypothetical protein